MTLSRSYPVRASGFTLIELLAASSLFGVLLLLVFQMVNVVSNVYNQAGSRIDSFSEGRAAFTEISERLSQATLFPYLDYSSEDPTDSAASFAYTSDLHFLCGRANQVIPQAPQTSGAGGHAVLFHATRGIASTPEGDLAALPGLLNATGFYVEYGKPDDYEPAFLREAGAGDQPARFRLVEILQPTEENRVYEGYADGSQGEGDSANTDAWIDNLQLDGGQGLDRHILADNIIALVIRPKDPAFAEPSIIAPDYAYDSRKATSGSAVGATLASITRHQLPPVVEVIVVSIDERSAARLDRDWGNNVANVLGLESYFRSASESALESDLEAMGERLTEMDVTYKIFRGDVVLKNSRWREDLATSSGN